MIIQFDVENFYKINEKQRICFVADKKNERNENLLKNDKYDLLPTIGIFGKNNSGKTLSIKALKYIRDMVINEKDISTEDIYDEPNFEINLLIDNKRYVYGFSHNGSEIKEEYLYVFNSTKPTKIFERAKEEYTFGFKYQFLKEYSKLNDKSKLFLSLFNLNGELNNIYKQIENITFFDNEKPNECVIEMINENANIRKDFNKYLKLFGYELKHYENEGKGYNKIYKLFPILYKALKEECLVIIDDLDMNLDVFSMRKIIKLFQDEKINVSNSQLIFTSNSPILLDLVLLRRDEIWFAENKQGIELFALADVKGVRLTNNIQKDYLKERYV